MLMRYIAEGSLESREHCELESVTRNLGSSGSSFEVDQSRITTTCTGTRLVPDLRSTSLPASGDV